MRPGFFFFFFWGGGLGHMYFSEKKLQKTTNVLVQEPIKQKTQFVFRPILTLIFPIFAEQEKGAKYVLKVLEYIAKILKELKREGQTKF